MYKEAKPLCLRWQRGKATEGTLSTWVFKEEWCFPGRRNSLGMER
jgi:hypothetical protein